MGKKLLWVFLIGGLLFLLFRHSDSPPISNAASETAYEESRSFAGDECTGNCSGHEAGYNWAEENNIDDEDICDTAGDHSNSPSFAEGCKAYVNGESSASGDDDEKDDEDKDE